MNSEPPAPLKNDFSKAIMIDISYQVLSPRLVPDNATTPATGVILMVVITIILACIVLSQVLLFNFAWQDTTVPAVFKITLIRHTDEKGILNYDSYMVVKNTGDTGYKNQNLYANTYRNGVLLECIIPTMNGEKFIDGSHHFGVQNLAGMGAKGSTWYPDAMIWIDYTDKTFHPKDQITFEVYDNTTKRCISRHSYTA